MIFSNSPIEVRQSIVANHLTRLYIRPEQLMPYIVPGSPVPASKPDLFADQACTSKVDPARLNARMLSWSMREAAPVFRFVGALSVADLPDQPGMMLVTDS